MDVIVPCYRYGHFLRGCVESILGQVGPVVRVLIIDDASPDDTAEVAADLARGDSRVDCRYHNSNIGHIATYNEGIAWAQADYMVLLSADDYLLPGALLRSTMLMDGNSSVGFTFGNAIALDDDDQNKTSIVACGLTGTRIISGLDFIKFSGPRNIVVASSAVVRTSLQKKLGGYIPELTHSGDMEMWLRFAAHGSVGFVDDVQAVYRRHSTNMSRGYSMEDDLWQRKAAFDIFFDSCRSKLSETPRLQRSLMRQLACDAVGRASGAFNGGDMELSERLSDLALRWDPAVVRTPAFARLAFKRKMGARAWSYLQPTADRMKHLARGGGGEKRGGGI